ncbi:ISAs1 family transposase [Streptomyces flaveus]|uniref:ISAs1 family transposase n=1 Tax=Streptomyces flaveus TaxID=66370 RepID=UPI003330D1ED
MCRQSATVCLIKSPTRQHRATGALAERLATSADPRCRRGKRHPFVAVLLIACSAVACGARSFVAIDEWATDAPQDVLARLGARTATALAVRIPPSGATIRRVIKDTCPGGLADLLGHDPAGADTLAIDGKSARGSRHGSTPAAHLPAAMTGTGMTVTQLRVPEKTNEITCFAALLDPYDLRGVTVTGDALHTRRDHARFLVETKKAHHAFTVKRNQKNLYTQLSTLPWEKATAKFYDRTTGHGRKETRVVQVLTVTDLGVDFPHAAQVAWVVRHRTDTRTGKQSRETVYVITDLTSRQTPPGTHREDLEGALGDRKPRAPGRITFARFDHEGPGAMPEVGRPRHLWIMEFSTLQDP